MAWDFEDTVTIPPGEWESWEIHTRGDNIKYQVEVVGGGYADIFFTTFDSSGGSFQTYYIKDHKHFFANYAEGVVKGDYKYIYLEVDNSDRVGSAAMTSSITVNVKWERQTSFWFYLEMTMLVAMLFSVIGGIVLHYRKGRDLTRKEVKRLTTRRERFDARVNSSLFKTGMVLVFVMSLIMFLGVAALAEFVHESSMSDAKFAWIDQGETEIFEMNLWNKGLHYEVEVLEGGPVDVYLSDVYRSDDPHVIEGQEHIDVTQVEATVRNTEKELYVIVDNSDGQGVESTGDVRVKVSYDFVWSNSMRTLGAVCVALMAISGTLGLYSRRVTKGYEATDEVYLPREWRGVRVRPRDPRPDHAEEPQRDRYRIISRHGDGSEVQVSSRKGMYDGEYSYAGGSCTRCGEMMVHGASSDVVFCPSCNWAPTSND
jgi:hypothetical protein